MRAVSTQLRGRRITTESKTKAVQRTAKGQFVKGIGGNPSGVSLTGELRTKQKIIALRDNLELAIRQGPLNAIRVCNIINKMISLAESGDTKAAKVVLALALSSAGTEDANKAPPHIKITVENATFKVAQVETPTIKVGTTIDGEFTETKPNE